PRPPRWWAGAHDSRESSCRFAAAGRAAGAFAVHWEAFGPHREVVLLRIASSMNPCGPSICQTPQFAETPTAFALTLIPRVLTFTTHSLRSRTSHAGFSTSHGA